MTSGVSCSSDRFIPQRDHCEENSLETIGVSQRRPSEDFVDEQYRRDLSGALFPHSISKVRSFAPCRLPKQKSSLDDALSDLPKQAPPFPLEVTSFQPRTISDPILPDFYTSNLAWGKRGILIGCGNGIQWQAHVYEKEKVKAVKFYFPSMQNASKCLSACATVVKWHPDHSRIFSAYQQRSGVTASPMMCSINLENNSYKIWMAGGAGDLPISSLEFRNPNELTVMSMDEILHLDFRARRIAWKKTAALREEYCQVKWNPVRQVEYLLANGDGTVQLFDVRISRGEGAITEFSHAGSVKAVDWSQEGQRFASGGGLSDQRIKIFDCMRGKVVAAVSTGSQVCDIKWLSGNVLASAHGFMAEKAIKIWGIGREYRLTLIQERSDLKRRVLALAKDPYGMNFSALSEQAPHLQVYRVSKKEGKKASGRVLSDAHFSTLR